MKFPCKIDEDYLQVSKLKSIEHNGEALKDTKLDVVRFYVYVATYSKWENRMLLPVVTSIKAIIRKGRICVAMRALGDRSNGEPVNRCSTRVWTRINAALSLTQLVGVSRSIDFEELCNAKLICLNREHMWQLTRESVVNVQRIDR